MNNWKENARRFPIVFFLDAIELIKADQIEKLSAQFDYCVIMCNEKNATTDLIKILKENAILNVGLVDVSNIDAKHSDIAYSIGNQNFKNFHMVFSKCIFEKNVRWKIFDQIANAASHLETIYLNKDLNKTDQQSYDLFVRWLYS
jgi:hypothetical protein